MIKKVSALVILATVASLLFMHSSCKSCKKEDKPVSTDTTSVFTAPVNSINLPHADTAVIPVLAKVLDEAFEASSKKDYNKLGSLIVYRGPDSTRYGYAVFNAKNSYDKKSLSITADVFNKWNTNVDSRDYARVFALAQPDGRTLPVLEVIFVSKKTVDRKFFGFLEINGEYKIADVTSNL
jgi:hypothetical protein